MTIEYYLTESTLAYFNEHERDSLNNILSGDQEIEKIATVDSKLYFSVSANSIQLSAECGLNQVSISKSLLKYKEVKDEVR